jgi:hypothetical protein
MRIGEPSRGRELRGGDVDAADARATTRQPAGHVRRAAAELDDVEPCEIGGRSTDQPDLGLRQLPDAPHDLVGCPQALRRRGPVARHAVPVGTVDRDVLGLGLHRSSFRRPCVGGSAVRAGDGGER